MQEAHEVVKDGVVVFWKALQDLAAVGHPQAALHACKGTRVPPEGRAQVRGKDRPTVGPGSQELAGRWLFLANPLPL